MCGDFDFDFNILTAFIRLGRAGREAAGCPPYYYLAFAEINKLANAEINKLIYLTYLTFTSEEEEIFLWVKRL